MAPDPPGDTAADDAGRLRPPTRPVTTDGPDLSAGAMSLGFEATPQSPTTPIPSGHLSHYRIIRSLGRGGMGAVYQAEDTTLGRMVALKIILPEYAARPSARERFLREARAAAALKNDHVVTIFQVGEDRGVPFLAMEFLEGESLEARMARGRVPLAEVVRIAGEMCAGLAAAHAVGLIHRDVKPANVWLEAPSGRVKLLDFGLARMAGSRTGLTDPGRVIGTPEYMSPEQARGEELDARSDLFSLGAVLYQLCTGRLPFQGPSALAVLSALATETPPPPGELNPDLPEALARMIERLLAKDREGRPPSAAAVAKELAEIGVPSSGSMSQTAVPAPQTVVVPSTSGPVRLRPGWKAALVAAGLVGLAALGTWALVLGGLFRPAGPSGPPIRVGILHSRTGHMSGGERAIVEAVQLAIEELNDGGGVLGRPVEGVVADGESEEEVFARRAEALIADEQVRVIFGCWTSASRKAVLPVVARHDHLLVYPVQYEGVEQSPHVIYLGPVPNQQIQPALSWLVGFQRTRRWFLVGSDYVFPRMANVVVRDEAEDHGAAIVGEEYLPLVGADVAPVVAAIREAKPDLIVNTINGDTNVAFYRALRAAGVRVGDDPVPVLSFSIAAAELISIGPAATTGDYVAGSYFESLETPANTRFVERYARRFGADRPVSDPMQAAYAGVHLWARAVGEAGTDDPRVVRSTMRGQSYEAPQGLMTIDPATGHTVQFARVGRIDARGRIAVVYSSPQRIVPEPYPPGRTPEAWTMFLDGLYRKWGNRWSAREP